MHSVRLSARGWLQVETSREQATQFALLWDGLKHNPNINEPIQRLHDEAPDAYHGLGHVLDTVEKALSWAGFRVYGRSEHGHSTGYLFLFHGEKVSENLTEVLETLTSLGIMVNGAVISDTTAIWYETDVVEKNLKVVERRKDF